MEAPKDPSESTPFLLLRLMADLQEAQEWEHRYRAGGMGYGDVKKRLLELLDQTFGPFRERRRELAADPAYVEDVLAEGGARHGSWRTASWSLAGRRRAYL